MDDLAHAGAAGRLEKGTRIFHRQDVVDPAMGEAHPVRVVQRRGAGQGRGQAGGVVEVQAPHLDLGLAGPPLGVPGEGADLPAGIEQRPAMTRPE